MEETTAATPVPDDVLLEILARIPDDVLVEILARVPDVAALFRCATTCKRWCSLIADRSFLWRRWPENASHPAALIGLFVRQTPSRRSPVFLPPLSPGSGFGSRSRSLASFIPGLQDGKLDGAEPLTARHGFLLVRLASRANDETVRLAVCNLLAGTCDMLPSLNQDVSSVKCAILTGEDYQPSNGLNQRPTSNYYSTFFKIIAVDNSKNNPWECSGLYTFSSAQRWWSRATNCFDVARQPGEVGFATVLTWTHEAVVCGGVAHWLVSNSSKYYTLDIKVETSHISLTEISISKQLLSIRRYGGPTLCVTPEGSPSLFWLQVEGHLLDMWMRGEDGAWLHAKMIRLKPPKVWNPSLVHLLSGEKSGVLLIMDLFRCVHKVDVESGAMEVVGNQFQNSLRIRAVSMEIDWPTLFMSRLALLSR